MKVLVTGGAGFIGSHTVDLLLKKGYEVCILDSLEPPVHPCRERPNYVPRDAEFIVGDVRRRDNFTKALAGADLVFHLAAYQGYLTDFSTFARVNDYSTALLYEIIVNEHLPVRKVIIASSQAVYGEGKYRCAVHGVRYPPLRSPEQLEKGDWEIRCPDCGGRLESLPTDESRVNPHNQYAVSKYCQELYALTLGRRFNIPTVALRYSITQGPRQSFFNAYSGILRIFATRLLNNLPPVIYEDGQQKRDYVSVSDVAQANLLVLENNAADFEVFNVGGGQEMTVAEYADRLAAILKKDTAPQINGEFRFGDTRHIVSDTSKLRKLGWQPREPLEQTIREYIAWVQQQPEVSEHYSQAEKVMRRQGVIRSVKQG